ncbi:MAG TPA: hypothetical protein VMZ49_01405 [Patescibacteria group bacterium]|nr:hypothetical protein [Patescibacteria group bacterium]
MTEQADRHPRRRRRWPFLFLLALAVVSLLLHAAKLRRQGEVQGLCDQEAMMAVTRPVEKTKAQRARFYQIRYFLGYSMAASHATADLVRRVNAIVAPLRLLAVQIDPGVRDLGFELAVEVAGGSREVRRRLAVFLERLRNIHNVTLADLSRPGPTARGGGVRVFTVKGRAELQP